MLLISLLNFSYFSNLKIKKDEKEFNKTIKYIDGIDSEIRNFNVAQDLKYRMLQNLSEERFPIDPNQYDHDLDTTLSLNHNENLIINGSRHETRNLDSLNHDIQKISFQTSNYDHHLSIDKNYGNFTRKQSQMNYKYSG